MPMPNVLIEKLADPALREAVPSVVVPSLKVTEPVGVPLLPAEVSLTVAVNVTDWPDTEGFTLEATVVEVVAFVTVSEFVTFGLGVGGLKLLSPGYEYWIT